MEEAEILVLSDDSVSQDSVNDLPEIDFVSEVLSVKYPSNRPQSVISICSNVSSKYSKGKSPQNMRQNAHELSDSDEENLPNVYVKKLIEVNRDDSKLESSPDKQAGLRRNFSPTLQEGKKKIENDCDLSPGKIHKSEYFRHIKNGEFLKCIKLVIGLKLHEESWWDEVNVKLRDEGTSVSVDTNTTYPTVNWLRLSLTPQSEFIQTDKYLLVWKSEEVAGFIKTNKLLENMRLVISDLKAKVINDSNIQITLVIYGMKDYLSMTKEKKYPDKKSHTNIKYDRWKLSACTACSLLPDDKRRDMHNLDRKAKIRKKRCSIPSQNDTSGKYLTENDLEMALTGLMLRLQVCAVRVESIQELSQLLGHCNKSVAEWPHKKFKYQYEDEAGVLRGENKTCIKVNAQGNGLLRVWQQALSKMSGIGQNTARELARKYPSPRALRDTPVAEIADFVVQGRRVGVEHARRLHTYLNDVDGNVVLI